MGEEDRVSKVLFFQDITVFSDAVKQFDISIFSNHRVPVKLHMGELKNKYFVKPSVVKPVISVLKEHNISPFLLDSTVAYHAKRHTIEGYLEVATHHGFTEECIGCPIIIDDRGKPVTLNNQTYEVIEHLSMADYIFAISHVKGHVASGMGGAIKNFGMGGVTKETKQRIHHWSRPFFHDSLCSQCGICASVCPFDAITVDHSKKWEQDMRKCFGCGVCVENCSEEALVYDVMHFQQGLAEAAYACLKDKHGFYLNVVKDIADSCDCDPTAKSILCPDIGFLLSDDPVAVDQASLDLIHAQKPDVFFKEHHVDPQQQIEFAETLGLGHQRYKLIELY